MAGLLDVSPEVSSANRLTSVAIWIAWLVGLRIPRWRPRRLTCRERAIAAISAVSIVGGLLVNPLTSLLRAGFLLTTTSAFGIGADTPGFR